MADANAAAPVDRRRKPTGEEYIAMQNSPEFGQLKKTFRSFTFPVFVAALIWYVVYVLTATFVPDFMAQPMWGMNVGLWFGLAQFLTTFIITWAYVVFANKRLEPMQAAIREEMEG